VATHQNSEAFVLAGGRSSRMGQDKALLQVEGKCLVEIALGKLRGLGVSHTGIAGAQSELSAYAAVIPDLHSGCGPLSGIEAALAATSQTMNLFLAVDLPLLPAPFLAWMLERAEITGSLMTVPRVNGRPQPLCAVYHRDLLGPISAALDAGNYKVMPVITAAAHEKAVSESGEQAIDVFDMERVSSADQRLLRVSPLPLYRWFHNCNTPHDMAEVENALVLSE
jgi:molybdenum cofactor guanylyltransferase